MTQKALVLLSGGQDSATCLAWAIKKFGNENVEAVTFNYGQRHNRELECAEKLIHLADILWHGPLDVQVLGDITKTAMTENVEIEMAKNGLPTTFVPGRNLLFIILSAALAYRRNIRNLVTGVCQTDYSGYPDCRDNTMKSLIVTINLGMDMEFMLHTPLMFLTKADTVRLMNELGHLDWLAHTHTCYRGEYPPCGECPSCKLRVKGFEEAGIDDPLMR